ncbi:MAG: hypothetical protein ACLU9S_24130 [Oscillospiraceae bacterium]
MKLAKTPPWTSLLELSPLAGAHGTASKPATDGDMGNSEASHSIRAAVGSAQSAKLVIHHPVSCSSQETWTNLVSRSVPKTKASHTSTRPAV